MTRPAPIETSDGGENRDGDLPSGPETGESVVSAPQSLYNGPSSAATTSASANPRLSSPLQGFLLPTTPKSGVDSPESNFGADSPNPRTRSDFPKANPGSDTPKPNPGADSWEPKPVDGSPKLESDAGSSPKPTSGSDSTNPEPVAGSPKPKSGTASPNPNFGSGSPKPNSGIGSPESKSKSDAATGGGSGNEGAAPETSPKTYVPPTSKAARKKKQQQQPPEPAAAQTKPAMTKEEALSSALSSRRTPAPIVAASERGGAPEEALPGVFSSRRAPVPIVAAPERGGAPPPGRRGPGAAGHGAVWGGAKGSGLRERIGPDLVLMLKKNGGSCAFVDAASTYRRTINRILNLEGVKLRVLVTEGGGIPGIYIKRPASGPVMCLTKSPADKADKPPPPTKKADSSSSSSSDKKRLTRTIVNDKVLREHESASPPRKSRDGSPGSPTAGATGWRNSFQHPASSYRDYGFRVTTTPDPPDFKRFPELVNSRAVPSAGLPLAGDNSSRAADSLRGGSSRGPESAAAGRPRRDYSPPARHSHRESGWTDRSKRESPRKTDGGDRTNRPRSRSRSRSGGRFTARTRNESWDTRHGSSRRGAGGDRAKERDGQLRHPPAASGGSPPRKRVLLRTVHRSPQRQSPGRGNRDRRDSHGSAERSSYHRQDTRGARTGADRGGSPARPVTVKVERAGQDGANAGGAAAAAAGFENRHQQGFQGLRGAPVQEYRARPGEGGIALGAYGDEPHYGVQEEFRRDGGAADGVHCDHASGPGNGPGNFRNGDHERNGRRDIGRGSLDDGVTPAIDGAAAHRHSQSVAIVAKRRLSDLESDGRLHHPRDDGFQPGNHAIGGHGGFPATDEPPRKRYAPAVAAPEPAGNLSGYPVNDAGKFEEDWAPGGGGEGVLGMAGVRADAPAPVPASAMLPPPAEMRSLPMPVVARAEGTRLMIQGTHPAVPERSIHALASEFGVVGKIQVLEGFVFVHMRWQEEADRAVAGLTGQLVSQVSHSRNRPLSAAVWSEQEYQALMAMDNMRKYAESMRKASTWYERSKNAGLQDLANNPIPCRFFALGRGCVFGQTCIFRHDQPRVAGSASNTYGAANAPGTAALGNDGPLSIADLPPGRFTAPAPAGIRGPNAAGRGHHEQSPTLTFARRNDQPSHPGPVVHETEGHGVGRDMLTGVHPVGAGVGGHWQPGGGLDKISSHPRFDSNGRGDVLPTGADLLGTREDPDLGLNPRRGGIAVDSASVIHNDGKNGYRNERRVLAHTDREGGGHGGRRGDSDNPGRESGSGGRRVPQRGMSRSHDRSSARKPSRAHWRGGGGSSHLDSDYAGSSGKFSGGSSRDTARGRRSGYSGSNSRERRGSESREPRRSDRAGRDGGGGRRRVSRSSSRRRASRSASPRRRHPRDEKPSKRYDDDRERREYDRGSHHGERDRFGGDRPYDGSSRGGTSRSRRHSNDSEHGSGGRGGGGRRARRSIGRGSDRGGRREDSDEERHPFARRREGNRNGGDRDGWLPRGGDRGSAPTHENRIVDLGGMAVRSPPDLDDELMDSMGANVNVINPVKTTFTVTARLGAHPPGAGAAGVAGVAGAPPATRFSITMPPDLNRALGPRPHSAGERRGNKRGTGRGRGGRGLVKEETLTTHRFSGDDDLDS